MMCNLDTPSTDIPSQVKMDLMQVRAAVKMAGGLVAQRPPDIEKMKPRTGQTLEILNESLDIGDLVQLTACPPEHTLPRLTSRDLLPPSSTEPVPLDYKEDPSDHVYVQERSIEFLVMARKRDQLTSGLNFLDKNQLQKLFDFVRIKQDHVQIMDTVRWIRVDPKTEISSMMLSTLNYSLFKKIRHAIRVYVGMEGYRIETYEKAEFVKKYGITMYVPRDNANLSAGQLLRTLFFKYPELYTPEIVLISRATFDSDPPDKPEGKRSRVDDRILLFDSPTLTAKLRPFDEGKQFFLNKGFSVTLKGGARGNSYADVVAPSALTKLIKSSSAEAMANVKQAQAE